MNSKKRLQSATGREGDAAASVTSGGATLIDGFGVGGTTVSARRRRLRREAGDLDGRCTPSKSTTQRWSGCGRSTCGWKRIPGGPGAGAERALLFASLRAVGAVHALHRSARPAGCGLRTADVRRLSVAGDRGQLRRAQVRAGGSEDLEGTEGVVQPRHRAPALRRRFCRSGAAAAPNRNAA